MRNYCRAYHTSIDYLTGMPICRLLDELQDAFADLAEERKKQERQMERERAKAKAGSRARPMKRRR